MSCSAFERYSPFIQEYIFRKGWNDLRDVQVEACEAILDSDEHVIIASGTASGKTEAAFFPILTALEKKPSKSVGILYVGPLKALINDQFERLSDLLTERELPVWPWHGDISQSIKQKALRANRGIIQITPESLEAMLMRRAGDARMLFADLRFIIIDEIHALMGTDRGSQLLCLLSRLSRMTQNNPRRIGLSATLSDYQHALNYLASGTKVRAIAVGIAHQKRTISLRLDHFALYDEKGSMAHAQESFYPYLYKHCYQHKCLIFTNSRTAAELTIAVLKDIAIQRNEPDIFYVHHGSVSASLRHETEIALKEKQGPTVAAATLTLELGIDIGDLDLTIQIGAPFSCSSFVQRLGRSGRRTGKSRMLFLTQSELTDKKSSIEKMPWELLRTIAIIQLYMEQRWVEPATFKPKPFSLLAHQTLSMLVQHNGLYAEELARQVLTLPPFVGKITLDEYRALLKHMLHEEYLQRMDDNEIIIGLKGERLVNFYTFYAVFTGDQGYTVLSPQGEVGSLDTPPDVGEVFILAGKKWQTVEIDDDRKIVHVRTIEKSKMTSWNGIGGKVHSRIVEQMRQVLNSTEQYGYLSQDALSALNEARELACSLGITGTQLNNHSNNSFVLCPWVGSQTLETIYALLNYGLRKHLCLSNVEIKDHVIEITSDLNKDEFCHEIKQLTLDPNETELVLPAGKVPRVDKYDALVPDELLRQSYLKNQMDLPGAMRVLSALT